MGIFKNKVGRPPNEIIKKRRLIIGGGIALTAIFIFTIIFIGGNLLLSTSNGVTTNIIKATTTSSKLVINSRRVYTGHSQLFNKDIYGKEYYIDITASKNVDVKTMSNKGKIYWRMVTLFGNKPVGTGYDTFKPVIPGARYYCYTWDLDGNIVNSNSFLYFG